MRILLGHNYYQRPGGEDVVFGADVSLQRQYGNDVIEFTIHNDLIKDINPLILASETIWSFQTQRRLSRTISDFHPDIAHFHNTFPLISPSAYYSCHEAGVPVIQTLHNYRLLCPSAIFYRSGKVCQDCKEKLFPYPGILHSCYRNSFVQTCVVALMLFSHRMMNSWKKNIDRFIVSNTFLESQLIDAGYPPKKIIRLLNPFQLEVHKPCYEFGNYILYFGRIDPPKGVHILVNAMQQIPQLRLVVVGSGPAMDDTVSWVKDNHLKNIDFVGPKWGSDLVPYLEKARLVIVPSLWNEPSPIVIYQSLATGKPVIGARIGGIPDLITPETGLLVTPGDVDDLVQGIKKLAFDDDRLRSMSRSAREWAEINLDPKKYYRSIIKVYSQVIEEGSN